MNQVRTHAVFETEPVEAYQIQSKGKLVFHRYGDKYFLYEVWAPGLETGRELPTSREERYVKREMAQNENATKSETVSIALN